MNSKRSGDDIKANLNVQILDYGNRVKCAFCGVERNIHEAKDVEEFSAAYLKFSTEHLHEDEYSIRLKAFIERWQNEGNLTICGATGTVFATKIKENPVLLFRAIRPNVLALHWDTLKPDNIPSEFIKIMADRLSALPTRRDAIVFANQLGPLLVVDRTLDKDLNGLLDTALRLIELWRSHDRGRLTLAGVEPSVQDPMSTGRDVDEYCSMLSPSMQETLIEAGLWAPPLKKPK